MKTPHPFHALIRRTRTAIAAQRMAWVTVAIVAACGWLPLLGGATGIVDAGAAVAIFAGVAGMALGVGAWAGNRVSLADAARAIDRELAGEWALFTAFELAQNRSESGFAAKLQHMAAARTASVSRVKLPRWKHPIVALVAVLWAALVAWMGVSVTMATSAPFAAAPEFAAPLAGVDAVAADARAAGDETTANLLAQLHAGDPNAIANALAELETRAAERRKNHLRDREFIAHARNTAEHIASGDLDADAIAAAIAELEAAAEAMNRLTLRQQLADLDAGAIPADIAEKLREIAATLDRQSIADRQLTDRLELATQAARRQFTTSRPSIHRPSPPANLSANRPANSAVGSAPEASGTGDAPATGPPAGNEKPPVAVESAPIEFAAPTADAPARDVEEAILPAYRGLYRRVVGWQNARQSPAADGTTTPDEGSPR